MNRNKSFVCILIVRITLTLWLLAPAQQTAARVVATDLHPVARESVPELGTFYCLTDETQFDPLSPPAPCPPVFGTVYPTSRADVFVVDVRAGGEPDAMLLNGLASLETQWATATPDNSTLEMGPLAYSSTPSDIGEVSVDTAPEIILSTIESATTNQAVSWRDARTSQGDLPQGGAIGILIITNTPFTITRVDVLGVLENTNALETTAFEVGIFRGTNDFRRAMLVDPEFSAAYTVSETNNLQMAHVSGDEWFLSFTVPVYAWGTNRVLTIRSIPTGDYDDFTKLNVMLSSVTNAPGATAFLACTDTNLVFTTAVLPAVDVWRQMVQPNQIAAAQDVNELQLQCPPGYLIGQSTNCTSWSFQTPEIGGDVVDMTVGDSGFFMTKPDDTE